MVVRNTFIPRYIEWWDTRVADPRPLMVNLSDLPPDSPIAILNKELNEKVKKLTKEDMERADGDQ